MMDQGIAQGPNRKNGKVLVLLMLCCWSAKGCAGSLEVLPDN